MKRVALISPKGNVFGKNESLKLFIENSRTMESFRYLWTGPNLGLLTVAAYMPSDWDCEYIDENYRPIDYERKYDIVCLSAMTQQVSRAYEIAGIFKERGALTVIGGIHATILPEEASKHVDIVIAGEGEELWPLFVRDYLNDTIKSVYRATFSGSYDLKSARMPRYELLHGYSYPIITLYTTRGCPIRCSFCCASNVYGTQYRRKDNSRILDELDRIRGLFPDRLILFADDNAFVKREESKELLKSMMGMGLRWIAQTDISVAFDEELLMLMTVAGCQWIVIGFESVTYENFTDSENIGPKLKYQSKYTELIDKIQSYGIGVYGTFIVGLDNDTPGVFALTTDFIQRSNLYGVNITVPTPLPGTQMRKRLEEEGRILCDDWSYYTFWDVTIAPKRMTVQQLEEGLLDMYTRITEDYSSRKRLVHIRKIAKSKRKACAEYKEKELGQSNG